MFKTFWFVVFLVVETQDFMFSAHTGKFNVTAEERNPYGGRVAPMGVLERIDPLRDQNGFIFYFLLPEKKIMTEKVDSQKVKFTYDDQKFEDINEKVMYENLEIIATISGGVVSDIETKTVFDRNRNKTAVTLYVDQLPPMGYY